MFLTRTPAPLPPIKGNGGPLWLLGLGRMGTCSSLVISSHLTHDIITSPLGLCTLCRRVIICVVMKMY